jgi:hypothetical protein
VTGCSGEMAAREAILSGTTDRAAGGILAEAG